VSVTDEFDISSVVEHQVLRLEITVDDTLGVKIFKRFDDASHTEARCHIIKVTPAINSLTITTSLLIAMETVLTR